MGEKSGYVPGGFAGLKLGYGEFRRLTWRGVRTPAAADTLERGRFAEQLMEPAPSQSRSHRGERPRIGAGRDAADAHGP